MLMHPATLYFSPTERLSELTMLLDKSFVVNFLQERSGVLVLSGSWNKMRTHFKIKPLFIREHLISDIAAAAERRFKERGLFNSGV